jgi:hypothetical protein
MTYSKLHHLLNTLVAVSQVQIDMALQRVADLRAKMAGQPIPGCGKTRFVDEYNTRGETKDVSSPMLPNVLPLIPTIVAGRNFFYGGGEDDYSSRRLRRRVAQL